MKAALKRYGSKVGMKLLRVFPAWQVKSFEEWIDKKGSHRVRLTLYGPRELMAIRRARAAVLRERKGKR